MHPQQLKIKDFNYPLSPEKIAKYPLEERDASKLLVFKQVIVGEDCYKNLAQYIPTDALMVYNQTKVVNARLLFKKPTGGTIEIFCLQPMDNNLEMTIAMQQKSPVRWECLVGGAAKWKNGVQLFLEHSHPKFTITAQLIDQNTSTFIIELQWDNHFSFAEILHYAGNIPLPPYLQRAAEQTDKKRYQTLFATHEGSVAAPTAGLHFTERVLQSLNEKGIEQKRLTLHVGAGTFKPVKSDTIGEHEMHSEWIEIERLTINAILHALQEGRKIIAVGTTSLRTLESLYWIGKKIFNKETIDWSGIAVSQWEPYQGGAIINNKIAIDAILKYMDENGLLKLTTKTQIIIAPGYKFQLLDGLITNFHQPESTLLLLIAALIGENWKHIYNHALHNDYRFLSYGDGMLLWNEES